MDLETSQTTTTAKLPILKQGPITTEEKAQKNNDVKARSMLLTTPPHKHLMTFNQYKDAKTLFAAIQIRFLWLQKIVKGTASSSSSSSSQNMAFMSSPSSTNEVNTAYGVSTANTQVSPASTASTQVSTANLSDDTVYAFLASQPNGSQLVYEDLEQIHEDDIEEMDLKWQLALLSMRTRRFFQKTSRKITINGSDTAGYDKSKVECFNCHKMGHFARECRGPRNQDSRNRNQDSSRRTVNVEETSSKAMVAIDGAGFDWSYMADDEVPTNMALMAFSDSEVHNDKTCSKTCLKSFETLKTQLDDLRIEFNKSEFNLATYKRGLASVEEQLVFYKKNEVIFCEQLAVLKRDISYKDSSISMLKSELENLKQEKCNQLKIEKFVNASKSLEKLIGSQITNKSRKGVRFVSYNVVPPPHTGLFSPLNLDLSYSGLEEFQQPEFEGYGPKTSTNSNDLVGTEESIDACHSSKETGSSQDYILMLLWKDGSLFDSSLKNTSNDEPQPSSDAEKKDNEGSGVLTRRMTKTTNEQGFICAVYEGKTHEDLHTCLFACFLSQEETKKVWTLMDLPHGKRAIGTKWVYMNKKDERVARIEAIRLFLAYASFKVFVVYQMDVKSAFMYGKIEEEVYVCQPLGFEDPEFPDRVYKVEKALYGLHQALRACQDKYVDEILKKFSFSTVKTASTAMETSKPLMKDENAEDVDVYLYRSMISSMMYLTSSRPDIMFAVCAYARFQVTPKVSHLYVVKRIFRYLKGQSKLGLWYPKDSPFDLEAYTDSDYVGASLNRKSIVGGCQFLRSRLISWQCKKQTIVANSTTEAKYVAAASCCGQVLWIQNQMLDYGYNFMNTKIFIDNESTICIVKNLVFHSKTKHIEIRHHFIRDSNEKKLIQMIKIHTDQNVADLLTKAFDVGRFQYLIASIGMLNL
ncbi:putative reverse transcriptase, RNA-dependent DNA polymerase [Tanacetum coccineum]